MNPTVEIHCPSCNQETLLLRKPVYEGLTKTGESLQCSGCGHTFASEEEVPFQHREQTDVFSEDDRSREEQVFKDDRPAFCRHCRHYLVNPFTQWCGLHKKEVEATETCDRFALKPEQAEPKQEEPPKKKNPLLD